MNINIPPDSRAWLFADHGEDDGGVWSFRWPPPCEIGDELTFRFDGKAVAGAVVFQIRRPGDLDGPTHNGRRYMRGWKVVWLWSTFRDLREPTLAF